MPTLILEDMDFPFPPDEGAEVGELSEEDSEERPPRRHSTQNAEASDVTSRSSPGSRRQVGAISSSRVATSLPARAWTSALASGTTR